MKLVMARHGAHNSATGALVIELVPDGTGTTVTYSGAATLGGPIAVLDNPLTRPQIDQSPDHLFWRLDAATR